MQHFQRQRPLSVQINAFDFDRLQDMLEKVLAEFTTRPQNDSVLLEDIALGAAATVDIPHTLGRSARGWKIVDTTAAATVFRDTAATADPTRYLSLQASANTTVSVEIF